MNKKHIALAMCTCLSVGLGGQAAIAKDNSDAVAGALLLLGAAALAHDAEHHRNGQYYSEPKHIHDFERGYNDGLYNLPYDSRHDSSQYVNGFAAGQKERHNRTAYRHQSHGAPVAALQACVSKASRRWDRNASRIHVIKSKKLRQNDFMVEVALGHTHGHCEVDSYGDVKHFRSGRM